MNTLKTYSLLAGIVGAAAIVVSLLFLAFQIKEQSAQVQRQVGQELLSSFSDARRAMFADPYPGQLLSKAAEHPDQLSAGEQFALYNLISEVLFNAYYYHSDISAGRIAGNAWPLASTWVVSVLSSDYGLDWWAKNKTHFPTSFVDDFNLALARV